jgi:hypothetical protein
MNRLRLLALLPMALAVASCGDSVGPGGNGCDVLSAVTIGSGTTPTFDWSPACNIAQLTITDETETDPDKKLKWSIIADQNVIRPIVTYGVAPANTTQTQAPGILIGSGSGTPAHTYSLTMSVVQQDGTYFVVALQNFTP